jgi:hypothetical protein
MKSAITCAIALTALIAIASPARAQVCEGEGAGIRLCGFVWADNGDGIQNDNTNPVPGNDSSGLQDVVVTLYEWTPDDAYNPNGPGQWVAQSPSETTVEGGLYAFFGVEDGLYKIVVTTPTQTEPTLSTSSPQGGDESLDSDGVNDTGGSAVIVCLGSSACSYNGQSVSPVTSQESDFGFKPTERPAAPGTGTPGYWKNHPEAWPSATITVGGITYTKAQAIAYMGKVSKDKRISLFTALVAAMLNVAVGNDDSCIAGTITLANAWMGTHQLVPNSSPVAAASEDWQQIAAGHESLDDYNNGRLPCAQHRN